MQSSTVALKTCYYLGGYFHDFDASFICEYCNFKASHAGALKTDERQVKNLSIFEDSWCAVTAFLKSTIYPPHKILGV